MAALVLLFAFGACNNDDKRHCTSPPLPCDERLPQSSPENTFAIMTQAYQGRDSDRYARLFAPDFVFLFSPADIECPHCEPPPAWFLDNELRSARKMFGDDSVQTISLVFAGGVPAAVRDSVYDRLHGWVVQLDHVYLEVTTRTEQNDLLHLLVPDATERFYLRPDSTQMACDGKPAWFIYRWEDVSAWDDTTDATTWGKIKWRYRALEP